MTLSITTLVICWENTVIFGLWGVDHKTKRCVFTKVKWVYPLYSVYFRASQTQLVRLSFSLLHLAPLFNLSYEHLVSISCT